NKLHSAGVADHTRRVLNFYQAESGKQYYADKNGHYWRLSDFIDGARTFDRFTCPSQAFHAASAFGEFQLLLADYDLEPLHDVIPGFLDGPARYRQLCQAIALDEAGRVSQVRPEIDMIIEHASMFNTLPELVTCGDLPLRITHNDTKINNVMLDDQTGEGLCVIDLDTVMPGLVHYDFGDLVRSVLSSSSDSDLHLRHGKVDLEMFRAAAEGYLSKVASILTNRERDYLAFSASLMALMLACRFLTDYLQGDRYFRITSREHNLLRCRSQLRLFQSLENSRPEMTEIIESVANRYL
ncbi:MAG: aminoglycoside phosphotransferase family protein, partial [Sedimentisphaerales bacterium]|nr:aminoglycoside phosphotransferase family protein [Sedimentisphaerales bacterium]